MEHKQEQDRKYKELAKPFESKEEAEQAIELFFKGVKELREQYRIPELLTQSMVYVQVGDEVQGLCVGAGFGSQRKQAQLAKLCFERELESFFELFDNLIAARLHLSNHFITDPEITRCRKADE